MSRPERPLDPRQGPVESFAYDLRQLRRKSGNLTYRQLAKIAGFSNTTLSTAARGERLPSLDVCLAYVRSCGGDVGQWEERWRRVAQEIEERESTPAGAGPAHLSSTNVPRHGYSGSVDTLAEERQTSANTPENPLPLNGVKSWTGGPTETMRSRIEHLERRLWQILFIGAASLLFSLAVAVSLILLMVSRM